MLVNNSNKETDNMKISRRSFMALMAAASAAPLHAAETPEPLKVLGKRKGINIGNAIGGSYFRDPAYKALMARECNMLVAENEGKWQALEPRQGQYNFGPADAMYAWAKEQGMLVRGHNLIWQEPKWLPKWVNEYDFGAQPARRRRPCCASTSSPCATISAIDSQLRRGQ
jgi:endo-1,4-beta-xylanase